MKTGYGFKTIWTLKGGKYVPVRPIEENDWYKPKEKRYGNGTKENTTEKALDSVGHQSGPQGNVQSDDEEYLHASTKSVGDALQKGRRPTR